MKRPNTVKNMLLTLLDWIGTVHRKCLNSESILQNLVSIK